jgi:hypothetical protein
MGFRRVLAACLLTVFASSSVSAQEAQREPAAQEPESKTPASAKRLEAGPAPDDGIPVLVVDAESGEPVANALVTWFEKADEFLPRILPEAQLEVERIEHGRTVATDAKGQTKIARSSLIVASADGRYAARRWSRATETPMKFALKRARRLDVVVVDEEKRPVAGAPLSLAGQSGSVGPARSWQVETGADGRASFTPLDLFLGFELRTPHELHLRVDAPLGESADEFARVLDDRKLPQEPVTFTLPPTGTLVVDVVDDNGAPVTGEHYLTIETLPAGTPDAAFDEANKAGGGNEWFCFDARPHYEIRFVVLHRRVQVEFDDDEGAESTKRTIDGPTRPGECVNAKFVLAPKKRLEIVATVVGPGDRPIADAPLTLRLIAPERVMSVPDLPDLPEHPHLASNDQRTPIEARSDASGRVKWSLEEGWMLGDFDEFERNIDRVELEQAGKTGVVAVARGAFPAANETRVHDLGTVKLVPTPRFISGRVIDDAGQPVAHAKIAVTANRRPKEGDPIILGSSGAPHHDQEFGGESGDEGTFVLFALPLPDADFEAKAEPPDEAAGPLTAMEYERHCGKCVAVHAGDHDVDLTFSRAGTITGTIEGDAEEIARLGYCLEIRRTDGSSGGQSGGVGGSEFSLEGIPVGTANLRITDAGGHPVARISDIVVRPGEVTRLSPIVLAEARHVLVLTIRDETGQPVAKGWVARPSPADRPDPFALARSFFKTMAPEGTGIDFDDLPFAELHMPSITPFRDGALTLRSNERFHALAVGAPGCCSAMLHDEEGATTVTLRPAPKVALVLDLEGELPKDETLVATLAPLSDDDEWYRFGSGLIPGLGAGFEESDRAMPVALVPGKAVPVRVQATGALRVRLSLAKLAAPDSGGRLLLGYRQTVTIAETRDVQEFRVRVSADALEAAMSPPGEHR